MLNTLEIRAFLAINLPLYNPPETQNFQPNFNWKSQYLDLHTFLLDEYTILIRLYEDCSCLMSTCLSACLSLFSVLVTMQRVRKADECCGPTTIMTMDQTGRPFTSLLRQNGKPYQRKHFVDYSCNVQ